MNVTRLWHLSMGGAAALLAAGATPASATVFTLTDSWTSSVTTVGGGTPTVSTSKNSTSNLGTVTPLSNPYTQSLTLNQPTANEILFVVVPNGSGTASIKINFSFSDNLGGTATASDTIAYLANASTDYDSLTWVSNSFNVSLSDGKLINVALPNETDWNMAQQVTFTQLDPTAVPEPASMVLLASGVAGLGLTRRLRRAA